MKLYTALVFTAISLAAASPLRVVVTSHQEVTSGDVTAHNVVAQIFPPPPGAPDFRGGQRARQGCHKNKTESLLNKGKVWIMGIMGHGPVVTHAALPEVVEPSADFMRHYRKPNAQHDDGPTYEHINPDSAVPAEPVQDIDHKHHRGPHHDFPPVHIMHMGGPGHHRFRGSFLRRMHFALMALGPWEGRAVAFVLGCGIGVLLRMFFVLSVVVLRAARVTRERESEADDILHEDLLFDAEVAPPPLYTEKAPLPVEAVETPVVASETTKA